MLIQTGNRNQAQLNKKPNYIQHCLQEEKGVFVAACDYLKVLPESVAKWFPGKLTTLGTDGFGRSDTRQALREFFEVDHRYIAFATLYELALEGQLKAEELKRAAKDLGIDPEKANPRTSLFIHQINRNIMAIEVKIPQISEGVDSAEVVEILVSKGDSIKEEQSIIAIETDKASVEVPSSHSGTVKEIKVKEGDEVKVGDVVLILEEDENGEGSDEEKVESSEEKEEEKENAESKDRSKEKPSDKEEKEEPGKKEKSKTADKKEEISAEKEEDKELEESKDKKSEGKAQEDETDGQKEESDEDEKPEKTKDQPVKKESEDVAGGVAASPGVRRLAREIGVDINNVEGSGPGGRIKEEDVKAQSSKKGDEGKNPQQIELPDFSKYGAVERESLSKIRKATAKNTLTSWQTVPHVFQFDEADISATEEYRKNNKGQVEESGGKLTITAILVKVMANALLQFPQFNASIDMENEKVILKKYYHIGVAVDTEKGLLVPVIRDVNKKTIIELAVEIGALSEKARQGKLSPEDMEGGNITISNLGGIGGTQFTPIVYSPQVAILGVSRAKTQAVYTADGNFEPRQILPLSLSYDHRMIDGADGARFLRWICLALEDPFKALLGA
tara:strand:- start:4934 stop:6790 length:1857 start_codon:yes stop_codon:yes gene_type:complete